jgi:hypothetical protein
MAINKEQIFRDVYEQKLLKVLHVLQGFFKLTYSEQYDYSELLELKQRFNDEVDTLSGEHDRLSNWIKYRS